jgi:hypothetical protein
MATLTDGGGGPEAVASSASARGALRDEGREIADERRCGPNFQATRQQLAFLRVLLNP